MLLLRVKNYILSIIFHDVILHRPFQWSNKDVIQNSIAKVMLPRRLPIMIGHHNSRGCHVSYCYSWKLEESCGYYEKHSRRVKLLIIVQSYRSKTLPLVGY